MHISIKLIDALIGKELRCGIGDYIRPHLILIVTETEYSNGLFGEAFGADLIATVCIFCETHSTEDGIAQTHKDVVDAVDVHATHTAP